MRQPEIVIPKSVDMVATRHLVSANGVKIDLLSVQAEVVRVSFVFKAGTCYGEMPFVASATANLMSEGTTKSTAHQIAERLDFYGSYFDVSVDRDFTIITFCCLEKFFDPTMEIASEIILESIFPQEEIDIYKLKRKESLSMERSKVGFKARELFAMALFGENNPYGASYPADRYDDLKREDILRFYHKHYNAENCFVVVSGAITESVEHSVVSLVEQLPSAESMSVVVSDFCQQRYLFSEHKDALQSAIRIGLLLFPRTHPDYISMQVVATILGGYFGSRLIKNLREEHGYTYGIFAAMVNLQHAGYMAIATEVATDATQDAIKQIIFEIERLKTEGVSEDELDAVRSIMIGEIMRIVDGPFGIADVVIEREQLGLEEDYLDNFVDSIRSISTEQVKEIANKYLLTESLTCVVVGDVDPKPSLA